MISLRDCMKCVSDTKCRAMSHGGRIVPTVTTGNLTGSSVYPVTHILSGGCLKSC
ncbi:hypothetical protein HDF09_002073 [Edaphobacter lichenicola]|uniref:Uncharacterized protein n=1 Tax=Tunturiibacter empetritectus TaxID=3069691 RepID=A0A7W8IHT1_9BACT|nr:hypothetical protein [Edaphobacter lichenicola]